MMQLPELRLPCRLIGCTRCCVETQMELTRDDIERLERLGYRREEFAVCENGVCRLRNVEGRCYFLSEDGCRVYEHRPLGCRVYPAVCVEGEGIAIDSYCPLASLALRILRENEELVRKIAEAITEKLGVKCPPRLLGFIEVRE